MGSRIDELWNNYFGKSWDEITNLFPHLGAVLLDRENQEFKIDSSTRNILGLDFQTDYEKISESVERIRIMGKLESPIKIKVLNSEEHVFAAVVYSENMGKTFFGGFVLPVIQQQTLLEKMKTSSMPSILALVSIEHADDAKMYDIFHAGAINAIAEILTEDSLIAAHSENRYWIYIPVNEVNDDKAIAIFEKMRASVRRCPLYTLKGRKILSRHNLDLTVGISTTASFAAEKMNEAGMALYDALSKNVGEISLFEGDKYFELREEYEEVELLSRIIGQNLIHYAYQPIVNAHTGDIVGYEALMRTDESIDLKPVQILELAEKYGRLYEIEKITFESNLKFLSQNQMLFLKRKLYVNSIPAHHINDSDWERLVNTYGELFEKVVIEMTEQTELSDDTLEKIKSRIKAANSQMAIDDYGTGYSNTSNLLRYNPMVVKIDRALISGVDTNQKMQKIVTTIIEFLHNSGYVALAEGVETAEELRYMIEAGADRIQGFYVSRPKPVAINEISSQIRDEIRKINQEISGEVLRVYHPRERETIDVSKLVEQKYTMILIDTKELTIVGDRYKNPASLVMMVKENTECTVNIKDLKLISTNSEPTLKLNEGCKVILNCEGDNSFERKGILVPKESEFTIAGTGNLSIKSEMKDCYAIGNDSKHAHGQINIELQGILDVNANGDHFIGIGAGSQSDSNIVITSGDIRIVGTGRGGIGIGCVTGESTLDITNCVLNTTVNSSAGVQMGSVGGSVDIKMNNTYYKGIGNGTNLTGIGALNNGSGNIEIKNCLLDITMKGERLAFIGTYDGELNVELSNLKTIFNGEGANIAGIGDLEGAGRYYMNDIELYCNFASGNLRDFGSRKGQLIMENCKEI